MIKAFKVTLLVSITVVLLIGGQNNAYAQNRLETSPEPEIRDEGSQRVPSSRPRIWLIIAKAVIDALCVEYGDCPPAYSQPSEVPGESRPSLRRGNGSSGNNLTHARPRNLNPEGPSNTTPAPTSEQPRFLFTTPVGWQRYDSLSSVTVAPSSEYVNGNLTNGVMLGLFDLKYEDFLTGTERYVRQLMSVNKYFRRIGAPESSSYNGVPCLTIRMQGQSPKTKYIEQAVVYTCKRSPTQLFYVVTVNSGPNASRFDEVNVRITQSIRFP
jgi:hypothetical protein